MTDAILRLRAEGYEHDFSAVAGARLRCGECGSEVDASELTITEVVRFEGESDPGDESVLYGLSGPCGHLGLYSAAYGPDSTAEDIAVAAALHTS